MIWSHQGPVPHSWRLYGRPSAQCNDVAKALRALERERVSAVEIVAELRAVRVPVSAIQLSTSLSEKQR